MSKRSNVNVNVNEILEKLKAKSVIDIINWMVTNLEVTQLIECLKEINPRSYQAFLAEKAEKAETPGTYPVNFPYKAGSLEDTLLGIIDISKNSRYIPIGYIPLSLPGCETVKAHKITIVYLRKVKPTKKDNWVTDQAEVASIEQFQDLVTASKKDIKIKGKQRISVSDIKESFYDLLQNSKYKDFITVDESKKTKGKNLPFIDKEFTVQWGDNKDKIDMDLYLMPYGLGSAWEYKKGEKVYHIYSRLFNISEEEKTLWNQYFNKNSTKGNNCTLLAYDDSRKCSKYFVVRRYGKGEKGIPKGKKAGDIEEYGWYREKDVKDYCNSKLDDIPKLNSLTISNDLDGRKIGVPFHTRVYGNLMPGDRWKNKEDLRMLTRGPYKFRDPRKIPTRGENCDSKVVSEQMKDDNFSDLPGPDGHTMQSLLLGAIGPDSNPEDLKRMEQQIESLKNCENDALEPYFDMGMGASYNDSNAFGDLQRMAAQKNVYITGVRFGKNPKFYTYLFNENNSKKWKKDRNKKNIEGQWIGEDKLIKELMKQKNPRASKGTTKAFMEFNDVMMNNKKFRYGKDMQLQPLHPSAFGYMQKVMKKGHGWPVDRSYGQLYPLGKDAYFKGRHQGISSTFSEQFSKKHGLWNPPPSVPAKQRIVGQFQYGNNMKKKKHSCFGRTCRENFSRFGKAEPNAWTRHGIRNAYTGKTMAGIADNRYGYKGTQWVYGGNTGVVGYPALGTQQLKQGLIPMAMQKKR